MVLPSRGVVVTHYRDACRRKRYNWRPRGAKGYSPGTPGRERGFCAALSPRCRYAVVRDAILDYVAQRDDADDADGAKAPDASGLVFDNGAERSEEYLLGILRERPDVTIAQLCDLVSKSRRQVQRDIAALKSAGRVRRVGPNRGGHWEVP